MCRVGVAFDLNTIRAICWKNFKLGSYLHSDNDFSKLPWFWFYNSDIIFTVLKKRNGETVHLSRCLPGHREVETPNVFLSIKPCGGGAPAGHRLKTHTCHVTVVLLHSSLPAPVLNGCTECVGFVPVKPMISCLRDRTTLLHLNCHQQAHTDWLPPGQLCAVYVGHLYPLFTPPPPPWECIPC